MGGDFQGKLVFNKETDRDRAKKMGVKNPDQVFKIDDLAKGNVMFCATGVTQGTFLDGVRFVGGGASTHSVVMRSETGTIRYIHSQHHFERKPRY